MDMINAFHIAGSGMKAQSDRLRVISQNIANADSVANTADGTPYRRKVLSFKNVLDREIGADLVKVKKYGFDKSDFRMKYEPGHPAANEEGYVKYPNVNPILEMVDMREAQRGYEANLNVIEVSKTMLQQTIGLLR